MTIIPLVYADGTYGSSLFFFKGVAGMRLKTIEREEGKQEKELIIQGLPLVLS